MLATGAVLLTFMLPEPFAFNQDTPVKDAVGEVLAAFLPVLAGQSGNTGCQALAITLRGITLGQVQDYPSRRLLRKEIMLGALNGAAVGVLAGIAMIGAGIGSGIFGVAVPLVLKRFGADPATASSIFLTRFTDVLGMGLMLFLASTLVL